MRSILLAVLFLPLTIFAQSLDFSTNQLAFGSVFYPNNDSLSLTITNNYSVDIQISAIKLFRKYEAQPFTVSDSVFFISTGQAKTIKFYFEPEQNINYDLEAVVMTDYRGAYLVDLTGPGKFLMSYYNATFDKSEQALKTALKSLLTSGFTPGSYSSARDEMFMIIDNQKVNGQGASQNTIEGVYTGQQIIGYTSRSDAQNQGFNTEHTFPQGFFNSNEPMRADLHHLFPTNAQANSERGNLPFGMVSGTPSWSVGGSKKGGGKFEPRDSQKGATARAMLYFVVKYQNYSNFLTGQESILRQWHDQYPPSQVDKKRNNDIDNFQHNRNPFVDYPQFVKRITSISNNSVAPDIYKLFVSTDTVDMALQTNDLLYTISIVNHGNKAISLTDFAIDTIDAFDFVHPVNDTVLLPGEGMQIVLQAMVIADGSLTEDILSFQTDIPGTPTVEIVLLGGGPTGIEENLLSENVAIYPNPADRQVFVKWGDSGAYLYELYDINGRLLVNGSAAIQTAIDLSLFAPGIYFITLKKDNVNVHRKIVVY